MAIVHGEIFGCIRGCVGGIRFYHNATGTIITKVSKKSVIHNQSQKSYSENFRVWSQKWKSLSRAEKQNYVSRASQLGRNFSGYNLFLHENLPIVPEPIMSIDIQKFDVTVTRDQIINSYFEPIPIDFSVDKTKNFIWFGINNSVQFLNNYIYMGLFDVDHFDLAHQVSNLNYDPSIPINFISLSQIFDLDTLNNLWLCSYDADSVRDWPVEHPTLTISLFGFYF